MTFSGVYLPRTFDPRLIVEIAQKLENLGFDSVWITDHLYNPYGTVNDPFPECWTTLTAVACFTSKIRIGSLVLSSPFRNPALVAKMSSTLDCLSEGRLSLAIGAGWFEDEFKKFGFKYEQASKRIQALEESIQIILGLWTHGIFSFSGKYHQCADAVNYPKPIQKPHPPLWVGGKGDAMLSVVAKYADCYNAGGPGPNPSLDEFRNMLGKLAENCKKIGRDFNQITNTWGGYICVSKSESESIKAAKRWNLDAKQSIIGTADQCIEQIKEYERVGAKGLTILFPDLWESGSLKMASVYAKEILQKI
jgi:alkanesulfonate monooxygenase SsuD/methylene tetrahydromethanopterin reductase-like flavin-dependent oxidoreductase (luciferase family)